MKSFCFWVKLKLKDLKRFVIKIKVDVILILYGVIVSLKKIKKKSKVNIVWSMGKCEWLCRVSFEFDWMRG